MKTGKIVTVFGSGLPKPGDAHYAEARALGAELARRGFVVCTGGYGGVMEAVSRGAKEAGGRTIGVTAAVFGRRANRWVDKEVRVKEWRDRLFELVERGQGYVVCRGGTGTLVELAVVWEMMNKGVMQSKPTVALGRFWAPVVKRAAEMESSRNGHSRKFSKNRVHFSTSARDAADYLSNFFGAISGERNSKIRSARKSRR
jgi:hypothetical protein